MTRILEGHTGVARILTRIVAQFYWQGMHANVRAFMQNCLVCQQVKFMTTPSASLLQPLPIPKQIWKELAIDFIT